MALFLPKTILTFLQSSRRILRKKYSKIILRHNFALNPLASSRRFSTPYGRWENLSAGKLCADAMFWDYAVDGFKGLTPFRKFALTLFKINTALGRMSLSA